MSITIEPSFTEGHSLSNEFIAALRAGAQLNTLVHPDSYAIDVREVNPYYSAFIFADGSFIEVLSGYSSRLFLLRATPKTDRFRCMVVQGPGVKELAAGWIRELAARDHMTPMAIQWNEIEVAV